MARKPKKETPSEEKAEYGRGSEERARDLIARYQAAKNDRDGTWLTQWQEIADYMQVRKSNILTTRTPNSEGLTENIFNMTAANANNTLASGMVNMTTPVSTRWFSYTAPSRAGTKSKANSAASRWYQECTEIIQEDMANSNFYTAIHELHLDRNLFGTTALVVNEGRSRTLTFTTWEVGTFVFTLDDESMPDYACREFKMSVRSLLAKFPKATFGKQVKDKIEEKDGKGLSHEFTILHAIYRRTPQEIDQTKPLDPMSMPVGACYLVLEDKNIIDESGFPEMPVAVGRFYTWSGSQWGWGPGSDVLPVVRQVNFLEEKMDVLAEKKSDPPLLLPVNMSGTHDTRAHGVTRFNPDDGPQGLPRTWGTDGEYNVGKDRIIRKDQVIEKAFFVDLFRMFADSVREMTAYEAAQRFAEKMDNLSPAFKRFVDEILNPLMLRVFYIELRRGRLPKPPEDVILRVPGMEGGSIQEPQVTYSSRMALAIREMENRSIQNVVNTVFPMAQADPTVLDSFNLAEMATTVAKNSGVPVSCIRKPEEIAAIQADRKAQQQAMMETELAKGASETAKNVGQLPPDMRRRL